MKLSEQAIQDLRLELKRAYGSDFSLNNEELNEIGLFLLISLAEGLKQRKYAIINTLH
jgi:hypothetical protein